MGEFRDAEAEEKAERYLAQGIKCLYLEVLCITSALFHWSKKVIRL